MNKSRVCKNCFEKKEVVKFAKAGVDKVTGKQKYRADCKQCHCKRVHNEQKEKALSINPENYNQCDDCFHIWFYRFKYDSCQKCGSEDFKRGSDL